jgi:hypothetical protein
MHANEREESVGGSSREPPGKPSDENHRENLNQPTQADETTFEQEIAKCRRLTKRLMAKRWEQRRFMKDKFLEH